MVSKFWNIGIGGQSNIGKWPNIGEKKFENIGIDFKKIISVDLKCKLPYAQTSKRNKRANTSKS